MYTCSMWIWICLKYLSCLPCYFIYMYICKIIETWRCLFWREKKNTHTKTNVYWTNFALIAVPLKSVSCHVTIRGFIADVEAILHYESEAREDQEAVFVFPLEAGGVVYSFTMRVNDRLLVGECQSKYTVCTIERAGKLNLNQSLIHIN